jgi:hypothetical protein
MEQISHFGVLPTIRRATMSDNDLVLLLGRWVSRKKLHQATFTYCKPSSPSFDYVFKTRIDELCQSSKARVIANKDKILSILNNGEGWPLPKKTSLRIAYNNYIKPSSGSYDQIFAISVIKILGERFDADKSKKRLIDMARTGEARPKKGSKDSNLLREFTSPSKRHFDKEYADAISLFWPPNTAEFKLTRMKENKKLLLEMAMNGNKRPLKSDMLGVAFYNYTKPSSGTYDVIFTENIRKYWPKAKKDN